MNIINALKNYNYLNFITRYFTTYRTSNINTNNDKDNENSLENNDWLGDR